MRTDMAATVGTKSAHTEDGIRRLPVFCVGDTRPVGKVEAWLVSPERDRELLVRTGWWKPVLRRVPGAYVAMADVSSVRIGVDRESFFQLPEFVPDAKLGMAVFAALMESRTLRYTALRTIEVHVRDGIVRLVGHVIDEPERREATRRAISAPGLVRLDDRLLTDDQVVDAVALAMVAYPVLQPSLVKVDAVLGAVVLSGELASQAHAELAARVARTVPGVRSIGNRLRYRTSEATDSAPRR